MEVILLAGIDGLGKKGDIVKVKNGFGRNYLIPHRRAIPVTPDNLYRLESLKKKFAEEEAKLVSDLKGVAARLEGLSLEILARANEEGHLFGSVNSLAIRKALAERGFAVSERALRLGDPIKAVGTYPMAVHLHAEVKARITVIVDSEDGLLCKLGEARAAAESEAPAEGAETAAQVAESDGEGQE